MVRADIAAPGAIAFLQTQALDRAVTGIGETVRLAGFQKPLIDAERLLGGNVQLPAQFADVADPQRKKARAADDELTPLSEGKSLV